MSVIYRAVQDGSCNKAYFHLLPGHVGGHTSRHRLMEKGGEQVCPAGCCQTPSWLSSPSAFSRFLHDRRGCLFVSREFSRVVMMGTSIRGGIMVMHSVDRERQLQLSTPPPRFPSLRATLPQADAQPRSWSLQHL